MTGVICALCGGATRVVDKRNVMTAIRRRRVCVACEARFTTWESTTRPAIPRAPPPPRPRKPPVEKKRGYSKRGYLRACARKEASQTQEPLGVIYARWGVA